MKKQTYNPVIIFSVFKDALENANNLENHNKVLQYLNSQEIEYKEIVKGLKNAIKQSILIADTELNRELTLDIIKSFDETDRVFRDSEGYAKLERIGENGKTYDLGYLLQVPKSYADVKENWLWDRDNNRYYALVDNPEGIIKYPLTLDPK